MGLGWDAVKKRGLFGGTKTQTIDLDASCLLFDGAGCLVDQVWFRQLSSKDGSIQHTGDNRTGAGDGDDESIIVDLLALSPAGRTLVFIVNSFTGQNFSQIENAFCRLDRRDERHRAGPLRPDRLRPAHRPGHGQADPRRAGLGDDRDRRAGLRTHVPRPAARRQRPPVDRCTHPAPALAAIPGGTGRGRVSPGGR